jgi:hypothetical protein
MDNHEVAEQYALALATKDLDLLGSLMHDEIVASYPQSGERFVGRESYLAMLSNFEGGLGNAEFHSVKGDASTIVTPSFQPFGNPIVTVFGGDRFVIEGRATYPGDAVFHMIAIIRMSGGRVIEDTQYFAPPFESPEWRKIYSAPETTVSGESK